MLHVYIILTLQMGHSYPSDEQGICPVRQSLLITSIAMNINEMSICRSYPINFSSMTG